MGSVWVLASVWVGLALLVKVLQSGAVPKSEKEAKHV
jgi:hypothetical protein